MQVSSKSSYAILILLDLALHQDQPPVKLFTIAERAGIPVRALEQVALTLRKSGYISSAKGAQGGYALSMPPQKIVIADLLRLFVGELSLTQEPDDAGSGLDRCLYDSLYDPLNQRVSDYLNSMTLQSLLDETLYPPGAGMYYI